MVFSSPQRDRPAGIEAEGDWALFRLLDQAVSGRPAPGTGRFDFTLTTGPHEATFQLRPDSAVNPFALPALSAFRCPDSL